MKVKLFFLLFALFSTSIAFPQQPETKVTLGIKPDYFHSGAGVYVKGIVKGKVAEKVGIKTSDMITKFDETTITGIFHYRDLLETYSVGDKVKVSVKRGGKTLQFQVTF